MVNVVMMLLGVLLPLLHLAITKARGRAALSALAARLCLRFRRRRRRLRVRLHPARVLADEAAKMIGWPAGNPFQFEVGLHDGAWGLLGFLCVFIGGGFWVATALGWSFFLLGAAYGHVISWPSRATSRPITSYQRSPTR